LLLGGDFLVGVSELLQVCYLALSYSLLVRVINLLAPSNNADLRRILFSGACVFTKNSRKIAVLISDRLTSIGPSGWAFV
jgi:hypothetical protein